MASYPEKQKSVDVGEEKAQRDCARYVEVFYTRSSPFRCEFLSDRVGERESSPDWVTCHHS